MSEQNWNHDLVEHILSLMDFFKDNGVSIDQVMSYEVLDLLPDSSQLQSAYGTMRLMDEIPGGFLIYRAEEGEEIVYANRGLLRIMRCGSWAEFTKLTGNSFRGIVHPDDLEAVEESIEQQVTASQFDLDYVEYRIIRKDGSIGWIEDYGHFVHSERAGDFFYVFLGDATQKQERQRGEKENMERHFQGIIQEYDKERTLINQEYLRRLEVIEGLSINYESILYADLAQNKVFPYRLSKRLEVQFGEKFQEKALDWYLADYVKTWVYPEDRETVSKETSPEYMRSVLSEKNTYYLNYRALYKGTIQYLQLRIVNVGQPKHVSQVVMGYRRVDEELQREIEQKQILAQALDNANLAIVAKNEFLANMSHDIRTPLNAVFGYTELAKKNIQNPQAALRYLERVDEFSRQLLELLDKVLEVSWMGANESAKREDECDLKQILQTVYTHTLPLASEKNLDYTLDCSGVSHSLVYGDQEKLRQLAMYLVNNAVTYTPQEGKVSILLKEREACGGGRVLFQLIVKDTGIGISDDFLKSIFEPFTRERNTTIGGNYGIGLGLTIAKHIAEQMDGTIHIDSTVGQGSTFTASLRLPLRGGEPENIPAPEDGTDSAALLSILLVEDNEINREIETEILRSLGFTVDVAENGRVALDKLRAAPSGTYGLVLMDIQMPVMDGWEASAAIRNLADPAKSAIPIIALSANVFESDIRKSLDSGMDAHLSKPMDIQKLLEAIESIRGRHRGPLPHRRLDEHS